MAAVRRASTLLFSGILLVAFIAPGSAQDGPPVAAEEAAYVDPGLEADALRARLASLAGERVDDASIIGGLDQARRALARASELEAEGRRAAAERARRIARAALILVDRRLALARERLASSLAQRRLERAEERSRGAHEARRRAEAQLAEMAATDPERP